MLNALSRLRDKAMPPDVPEPREGLKGSNAIEGNALFEAMVCEFHWTALQVGGVACVVNAAQQKDRAWILRSCQNLMPVEAATIVMALKDWKDLAIPVALARSLSRIYTDLSDAKRLTGPLIEQSNSFGGNAIPSNRLQQLLEVWRHLAQDCLSAVQELEPQTRWRLTGNYSENAIVLAKFLKDAVSAKNGYVDPLGNLSLPVLPQRRREPRFLLLQKCVVHVRGQAIPAVARDVSQNGLGIACGGDLRLKETVIVELRGGRKLKGRIVWIKNGQQGIQFEAPLPNHDPLITT